MNETLRNIGENYIAIRDELFNTMDEETGEVNSEVLERLNSIQESFEAKAQNVALVCLELKDRKNAIDGEIARLKKLSKMIENREKQMKEYLKNTMISSGHEQIFGKFVRISFNSSEETIIDDMTLLPKEYIVAKVEYDVSKNAIKQAIKSGKKVAGAHIEKKKNLQIK